MKQTPATESRPDDIGACRSFVEQLGRGDLRGTGVDAVRAFLTAFDRLAVRDAESFLRTPADIPTLRALRDIVVIGDEHRRRDEGRGSIAIADLLQLERSVASALSGKILPDAVTATTRAMERYCGEIVRSRCREHGLRPGEARRELNADLAYRELLRDTRLVIDPSRQNRLERGSLEREMRVTLDDLTLLSAIADDGRVSPRVPGYFADSQGMREAMVALREKGPGLKTSDFSRHRDAALAVTRYESARRGASESLGRSLTLPEHRLLWDMQRVPVHGPRMLEACSRIVDAVTAGRYPDQPALPVGFGEMIVRGNYRDAFNRDPAPGVTMIFHPTIPSAPLANRMRGRINEFTVQHLLMRDGCTFLEVGMTHAFGARLSYLGVEREVDFVALTPGAGRAPRELWIGEVKSSPRGLIESVSEAAKPLAHLGDISKAADPAQRPASRLVVNEGSQLYALAKLAHTIARHHGGAGRQHVVSILHDAERTAHYPADAIQESHLKQLSGRLNDVLFDGMTQAGVSVDRYDFQRRGWPYRVLVLTNGHPRDFP